MNFRKLNEHEIGLLCANGCTADDWHNVSVSNDFQVAYLRNVQFSGTMRIGKLGKLFTNPDGLPYHSGIFNARLHNCVIGDDVYINSVSNYIANYVIEDGAYIEHVNKIFATGKSSYGNGTRVSVLNEAGGREVPIYDNLSAHLAYVIAMYRYWPDVVDKLTKLIDDYSAASATSQGRIGQNAVILNTGEIIDVNVGAYARIDGTSRLLNGTIAGSSVDPVVVGCDVIADSFIICSGSVVDDGAMLTHTFVGQGCHITRLFSAHDSLFFANCMCENGEAAAIFGGPYTVSMHKSSLLIAGMFSFLNAGSGSNQSNHMYKLGPIHQGVVERGSKTTSDSYILWPAKIGAFTLVMGRHVSHPDTSKLPFSYIIENKGRSYIVPGVNLKSVGTIRDAQKWPKRDRRKDTNKLDFINFNLLSPYTVGRMFEGIELLDLLQSTSGITADRYSYQSMTIEPRALRKGKTYYNFAIDKFMGNSIIKRLEGVDIKSIDDIHKALLPTEPTGKGEWIDVAGLILPKSEIIQLLSDIESDKITNLGIIETFFKTNSERYYDMEWTWVVSQMKNWCGKECGELTLTDVISLVKRWQYSVVTIDQMLYDDAKKEFSMVAKTGFGVDGGESRKDSDFEQVRGAFESDSFVKMVTDHIANKTALGDELITRLSHIVAK